MLTSNILIFILQKLLGELQDDIQNVSAKAYSNDLRYQNAQLQLSKLDEDVFNISKALSQRNNNTKIEQV